MKKILLFLALVSVFILLAQVGGIVDVDHTGVTPKGTVKGDWAIDGELFNPKENFVQIAASGVNPVGGAGAAVVNDYGITSVLEFSNGNTRIAAVNIAFPGNIDRTKQMTVRLGYSNSTNTGNIYWSITYLYIGSGDPATGQDGEVFLETTVPIVADTYGFASFTLPSIAETDRIVELRVTRYGGNILDTNGGTTNLLGILLAYTTR